MDKIAFDEYDMKRLSEKSGLSILELTGLIAMMNEIFIPNAKSAKDYAAAEARGDVW